MTEAGGGVIAFTKTLAREGVRDNIRDIAPVVAFLASDDAGYITGQTLSVSGGLTMV